MGALAVATPCWAQAAPLKVVAAENFYGDVVQQLGGAHVSVTCILSNPDQDPHLFEARASAARALSAAQLVVYNGIDYDSWMNKLLAASKTPARKTIVVGEVLHKKSGDNPHLWYAPPPAMPTVARAVTAELEALDPANKADYEPRLHGFLASFERLVTKVTALRGRYAGAAVTATEPVFGCMADALGITMHNERFQLAVMNDIEPSAAEAAAFERDLKTRRVKVLLYNSLASSSAAQWARKLAVVAGVPVVG